MTVKFDPDHKVSVSKFLSVKIIDSISLYILLELFSQAHGNRLS